MGENTAIEWAHHTFNPWRGCTHVSPGCEHCYAETLSARNPAQLGTWGAGGTRAIASESYWRQPVRWDRRAAEAGERHRVFCASLADVFEDRPELVEPRARLFALISATPHLDWLLLTKRPEVARVMLNGRELMTAMDTLRGAAAGDFVWPLPNLWLGTSIEDQRRADERLPELLAAPAALHFVSAEPLLSHVDLSHPDHRAGETAESVGVWDPWLGNLGWVIVGGESGKDARPMAPFNARSLRDQCAAASVPFLFKQWGEWAPMYGKARVANKREIAVHPGGMTALTPDNPFDPFEAGHPYWDCMERVGKRYAGRELDGQVHDAFPEAVRACRVCGCTQERACDNGAYGCWWVDDPLGLGPLCSSCLPRVVAA